MLYYIISINIMTGTWKVIIQAAINSGKKTRKSFQKKPIELRLQIAQYSY